MKKNMDQEDGWCQNCKTEFTIEPVDFAFYEKMKVPPPTFCPDCRKQRRLAWRNDMTLYSRTCDLCKKNMVSIYSPDSGLTVYCVKCWWSDAWDPKSYAREYDFSKNFFLQMKELQVAVPRLGLMNDNGLVGGSINCEYNQDFARAKNCYMVFVAWKIEDCLYSYYLVGGKSIVDSLYIFDDNDSVYESIFVASSYRTRNAYNSSGLSECSFAYDCRDSSCCFMCVGLRHKKYCFKNKEYSKEEYEKILGEYKLNTYSGSEYARQEFDEFLKSCNVPRRFANFRNCVNSTGDYLSNCKNSKDCFFFRGGEDCRFVDGSDTLKDTYDLSTGGEAILAYEGLTPDHTYNGAFGIFAWKNSNYYYLDGCHSSENCFGCVGLKKAKYTLLNKEYTKAEYETLIPRVIEHMSVLPYKDKQGIEYKFGEFYPSELSYFGYNETIAQERYAITKEQALIRGLPWQDKPQFTTGKETLKPEEIADAIEEIEDSILEQILACVSCERNYRLTRQELEFYRRMKIPVPRKCFYCRHKARVEFKNPAKLWSRTCDCEGKESKNSRVKNTSEHFHGVTKCPNEFQTTYAPNRPEIVYCEQCYQSEVV